MFELSAKFTVFCNLDPSSGSINGYIFFKDSGTGRKTKARFKQPQADDDTF